MTDILLLNKQVFATTIRRGGVSRRAKKAMTEPLQATTGIEMTYDDCECVDGGGRVTLTLSCTAGGFVRGLSAGLITGFVTGLISGFATKLGMKMGGLKGMLICGALGAIAGLFVSSSVNELVYGSEGASSITLIDIYIPFFSFSFNIDIAKELGKALSGFGGGAAGGGLSIAAIGSLGYVRGMMSVC